MDLFTFGRKEFDGIVIEREYIDSDRKQVKLLYTKTFKDKSEPKANFVIVHGLGEHAGRYFGIAKNIAD